MIPGDTAYSGLYGEAPPERGAFLARRSTIKGRKNRQPRHRTFPFLENWKIVISVDKRAK